MSEFLTDRWFTIPKAAREHPVQRAIAESKAQYIVIAAGRRSYKTERFIKRDAVRYCIANEGKRVFCGAPTRTQAKAIFWQDLQDLIPNWAKGGINKTDLIIHFKNGSQLHVVGLEAHRRIEGVMWHRAYITEMQEVSPDFFGTTLEPILNDTGGRGVFEGRPIGKNHFFDLFNRSKKEPDLWASFTWTSEGILTPKQIENAKRTLAEEDYKREYLASFDVGGQRAYYAFNDDNLKRFDLKQELPIIITWDFNATVKPMSVTIGQEHDGYTWWWKSISHAYTNTVTMCKLILQEIDTWGFKPKSILLYGDYTGGKHTSNSAMSDWEHIRQEFAAYDVSHNYKRCDRVRDRVAATNARLCNTLGEKRTYIHPDNCIPLIDDLERVQWKENGIELDQDKDPKRTHNTDSIDYYNFVVYPIRPKTKGSIT